MSKAKSKGANRVGAGRKSILDLGRQKREQIIKQLEQLTGAENQDYVRNILRNIDNATSGLDRALTDFSEISETLRTATDQVTAFVAEFEGVGTATQSILATADTSFVSMTT